MKTIAILGATGSIGDSTLDLIRHRKNDYDVQVLTAGSNIDKLAKLAHEFNPSYIAIADTSKTDELKNQIPPSTKILSVPEAALIPVDWTMAAITGTAGLIPAMNAIKNGNIVAFASKECLVAAGNIMMNAVNDTGATLLPVDSEHNAIFQVFDKSQQTSIKRLILTASGGPFRTWDLSDFSKITPDQALKHPTWSMGAKITIDSATLMNKALEVIEAHYLFDMPSNKIDVIVHPQSLIHSMVEYNDGSILSQMGPPDMRTPIAHCLSWPMRIKTSGQTLDFSTVSQMTFESVDTVKFKSMAMVRDVLSSGQGASITFNAANEIAVAAFLANEIHFTQIFDVIQSALDSYINCQIDTLDDVMALDETTRLKTRESLSNIDKRMHYA